jgi:hypothetical protein
LDRLRQNLGLEKASKKIENFYELDFAGFLSELTKLKIKLTLKEHDEGSDYFNGYKKDLVELKDRIDKTDKDIDPIVYKLYGLTPEEIRIVEDGLK